MILRKVKINGYWGQECVRVGTFVVLAVFCLLVWVVVWMYFYYSLQLYTYFRYLYISQLKEQKKFKALNCYRLFSHTVLCKDQLMVCWKLFNFPPNRIVKISSFVLHGGFGIDCSSAVSIMQRLVRQCGRRYKKLQGSPKTDFQMDHQSLYLSWHYYSHNFSVVKKHQISFLTLIIQFSVEMKDML